MHSHLDSVVGALGFRPGGSNGFIGCKDYSHSAMAFHFRLTENTQLHTRFTQHIFKVAELYLVAVALYAKRRGRGNGFREQEG